MITYLELVFIFLIAVSFIILFKIQKTIFSPSYFSSSQFILDKNVTYKMLGLRYVLILLFSLASNFIFNDKAIVIIGVLLGSFLIIWPTLLAPSEAYWDIGYIKTKDKLIIYFLHFIFVISSTLVAYFGTILFPVLKKFIFEYKSEVLYDLMKFFFNLIFLFLLPIRASDYLNKSILNNEPAEFDE